MKNFTRSFKYKIQSSSFVFKNTFGDAFLSALVTPLARWLADPRSGIFHPLWFVTGGVITLVVSGICFRMPQQYWRYSSLFDLHNIIRAAILSALSFAIILWCTGYGLPTPTFPIIHALLLIVVLGGVRAAMRYQSIKSKNSIKNEESLLLVGSEEQLDLLIRALYKKSSSQRPIVGLVTIASSLKGQCIHGIPILGKSDDIKVILASLEKKQRLPTRIILTELELRGTALISFISSINSKVNLSRISVFDERESTDSLKMKSIMLDDLLNRPSRKLSEDDATNMRHFIVRKSILITGAGGSIGHELVRQIASFNPDFIVLLDQNEYALWKVSLELSEKFPILRQHRVLADIQKKNSLKHIFKKFRPQIVFHAAALKHVPYVEESSCEGILTNTIGTRNVADCACEYGSDALVFISTDKAVYPSSIMGASKRCAEMYVQALDRQARLGSGGIRCVCVRFGNVLGSTGSVVPLFKRQLAQGGPLTVTHPDMCRYFMTIPEAVGLVLQAAQRGTVSHALETGKMGRDFEAGSVFVLDMGEPIKIIDLARHMIRLAGLRPEEDIAIRIIGTREGEKLTETLFYKDEKPLKTGHDSLWIVKPSFIPYEIMKQELNSLEQVCHEGDEVKASSILRQIVPEFISKEPSMST